MLNCDSEHGNRNHVCAVIQVYIAGNAVDTAKSSDNMKLRKISYDESATSFFISMMTSSDICITFSLNNSLFNFEISHFLKFQKSVYVQNK